MSKQCVKYIVMLSLSVMSHFTLAAEQATAKTLSTPPVSTTALFETLLGLVLVLSLIAFLAWLLRRTGRFQMTANGEMKIIASLALGPRERAVLLQVGEQQLLLGVTAQNVQTLHVLDKNIDAKNSETISSGFAQKLNKMMQQGESKT